MDEEKIVAGFRKAVQDFFKLEREVVRELKQLNKRLGNVESNISELREDIREVLIEEIRRIKPANG
jgi:hypothetical protein